MLSHHIARGQSHLRIAGDGQLFRLTSRLINMFLRLMTDTTNLTFHAELESQNGIEIF